MTYSDTVFQRLGDISRPDLQLISAAQFRVPMAHGACILKLR